MCRYNSISCAGPPLRTLFRAFLCRLLLFSLCYGLPDQIRSFSARYIFREGDIELSERVYLVIGSGPGSPPRIAIYQNELVLIGLEQARLHFSMLLCPFKWRTL